MAKRTFKIEGKLLDFVEVAYLTSPYGVDFVEIRFYDQAAGVPQVDGDGVSSSRILINHPKVVVQIEPLAAIQLFNELMDEGHYGS